MDPRVNPTPRGENRDAEQGTYDVSGHSFRVPRGSYPTPFLGYLVLRLGSVILKSRRPKTGVGYEPLGIRV